MHLLRLLANGNGDIDLEMQILNTIFTIDANHVESLNGLGDALRRQGQAASGIEPCRRAIALRANYTNAHNTLGLCYFETGAFPQAAECFRRALSLQPNLAAAQINLSACLSKLGRKGEATEAYQQAARMVPNSPEVQEALGSLLNQQGRNQEAQECFKRILRMQPNSAKANLLLAESLQHQGQSFESVKLINRALEIEPNSALAHCLLGYARHDLGEFQLATACFERSIAIDPLQADAYLGLVTSKKTTLTDRLLLESMIALLQNPGLSPADQAQIHTALGKAFDDLGEYEQAISHVDEGNGIALGLEGESRPEGSREAAIAYVEKTINTFTTAFFHGHSEVGVNAESPIFIVGLPRSGTTLLEQILSSHSKVAAAGEIGYWDEVAAKIPDRFFGLVAKPNTAKAAAQEYLRQTSIIGPNARFVTDKYNDNFFNLGFLHLVFPNARIIHCRRNPSITACRCTSPRSKTRLLCSVNGKTSSSTTSSTRD